jgi:myo-inositol-1(or 4)-monophosphatase
VREPQGGDRQAARKESVPTRWAEAPPELGELLALATDLVHDAGQLHTEGLASTLRVKTKSSPTDMVSDVDHRAERLIVGRLADLRPGDAVFGEEGSRSESSTGVRWVIDPLDGTTNYVYGYPAFAVSIGVEIDGQPRIGVVYDSSAGHLYQAISGLGARCDGRPIRARRQDDLSQALVATGFSYDASQREKQGLAAATILGRVRDMRRSGSAALDLCHIAAGHLDAFWELDLSPWDYAAGSIIAREAGAEVAFLQAAHGRGPAVVAVHPTLMPAFLGLLRDAGALA